MLPDTITPTNGFTYTTAATPYALPGESVRDGYGLRHSANLDKLALALCRAQGQMLHAVKDSANPFFKSKYADLTSVWDAIRIPFQNEGLSITQFPTALPNGQPALETVLLHSSGQWMAGCVPLAPAKNDPQGVGSALTYMRRYALQAVAGVCADDDDGEAAHGRAKAIKAAKFDSQGNAQTKIPPWSNEEKIQAGTHNAEILALLEAQYGNADAAQDELNDWKNRHKYDPPKAVIDALKLWIKDLKGLP